MYIIRRMRVRTAGAVLGAIALSIGSACSNPLGRQYEYEEQLYLDVNGAATVIVDSSIAALVALRGVPLDSSPSARTDRDEVKRVFEARGCRILRVGQPWRRDGRSFVQIRMETDHVQTFGGCGLLGWSNYVFETDSSGAHFAQKVGASTVGDPGKVNWNGKELVAFKLHLPSRILYHNVRRIEDGLPGEVERGNILTWEQSLADRRASKPVNIDVRIDAVPILHRTLWLFGGSFLAALIVVGTMVWFTVRHGRKRVRH
jgi:hypothetical protein